MYYTPIDDTYVVDVLKTTGVHQVLVDPKYPYWSDYPSMQRGGHARRRQRRTLNDSSSYNDTVGNAEKIYVMEEKYANDFNSFITVDQPDMFLVVRDVRDRLVITLPNSVHNLKIARFYLILHGRGGRGVGDSYGTLFFRQDQPHIDLFVFFSVFFSCFFLFLAVCVLMWKSKQAFDSQRSRHQRRLEMEHMASRPFAKVLVTIDHPNDLAPDSPRPTTRSMERGTTRSRLPKYTSKYSLSGSNTLSTLQSNSGDDNIRINPMALEPTDDGFAAVGTFFFQLPGGSTAPVKACLGSALLTMRVMYPNHPHLLPKPTLRRRASHNSVST